MGILEETIAKIEDQQKKVQEYSPAWLVGEQLKDMLRAEPELAELVNRDLDVKGMGLEDCERKIKARCDELHRKLGRDGVGLPGSEAEGIIRKFYGLPERGASPSPAGGASPSPTTAPPSPAGGGKGTEVIDLADFF